MLDPQATLVELSRDRLGLLEMDVVDLEGVHELWITRELVVVIAGEERDADRLSRFAESLEDKGELRNQGIELVFALDLGELPEPERVSDDDELHILGRLRR